MPPTRLKPYVEIPTRRKLSQLASSVREPSSTTCVESEPAKKFKTVLEPYVELSPLRSESKQTTRPETPTPESSAETEYVQTPPRKRRRIPKYDDEIEMAIDDESASIPDLRASPTVSDIQARLQSPTVSEIAAVASASYPRHLGSRARPPSPIFSDGTESDMPVPVIDLNTDTIPSPSRSVTPTDLPIYEPSPDEMIEDADLTIDGEALSEDTDSDFEDNDDIPVRQIQDFTIYILKTKECIDFASLVEEGVENVRYGASGVVRAWFNDTDDKILSDSLDENDDHIDVNTFAGERIQLSRILEMNMHHFDEDNDTFDGKIYLRTKYAWYILDSPSVQYQRHFFPFFVKHRLCHLVLSWALKDETLTLNEFLQRLNNDPNFQNGETNEKIFSALIILGRSVSSEDMKTDEARNYMSSTIPSVISANRKRLQTIKRVPIIKTLLSKEYEGDDYSTVIPSNKEKAVLLHSNDTVVTPVVSRIVKDLYNLELEVSGETEEQDQVVVKAIKEAKEHNEDPKNVKWGPVADSIRGYYESVTLDGEVYRVGNDVMVSVNPEDNDDEWGNFTHPKGGNKYANHVWFVKIAFFFDHPKKIDPSTKKPVKMFHGQWFQHGSRTILQEVAHTRSLYLTDQCDDNPVASIFRRCSIRYLPPEAIEEEDDCDPTGSDFHCSLMWDNTQFHFIDIPTEAQMDELCAHQLSHERCVGCALREKKRSEQEVLPIDSSNGITRFGVNYHKGDCVYIKGSTCILDIAQIEDIKWSDNGEATLDIRLLPRRDDNFKAMESPAEERRLYLSQKVVCIDFSNVEGKCYVKYFSPSDPYAIAEWIQHDDHWYLNEEGGDRDLVRIRRKAFQVCHDCLSGHQKELEELKNNLMGQGKLRGLELFSGAGGLGTGMNSSGYVDTKWAVEISPAAAMSYRANHPDTIVYCQDSNLLLKHAIQTREGKNPKPLVSNFSSKEKCKEMPRRGDVDFIFGGPPCQAFSGANHTPKADDIRSTLPCNMLSFVEEYDPDYFLLENVTGLLRYPLLATTDLNGRRLTGGIKMGVVKMIMRVLIALGYQVHFRILEAGQYGCPQSRKRIIFLGAKRGLKLPDFPIPTHAFTKACAWKVPCNPKKRLLPITRSKDPELIEGGFHHYAPMNPISINDAIGDLPSFEWKNPHHIIKATAKDKKEAISRKEQGIKQVDAIRSGTKSPSPLPGFPSGAIYAKPSQNAYQKWMREKMKEGERVMDHVTKYHKANIIESVVTMPLEPDVYHTVLPVELQPPCARPGEKQADKVFYGRANESSFFRTALTTSSPTMKGIWPLHPSQKRVYTIREAARSQGFPDHYKFLSEKKLPNWIADDQQRQIGNAVPVPLALALGKALGDTLKTTWKEKRKEGSPAI